jgi:hypothetical protein
LGNEAEDGKGEEPCVETDEEVSEKEGPVDKERSRGDEGVSEKEGPAENERPKEDDRVALGACEVGASAGDWCKMD